jgi:N-dimethylarginine dimethylaminohydrolase
MRFKKHLLMVTPEFFDVTEVLNPHMKNDLGHLNLINKENAKSQWQNLKNIYKYLGCEISVIDGQKGYPDMVFSANQCLPVYKKDKSYSVILSHMAHPSRKGEVAYFKDWFNQQGYESIALEFSESNIHFEGMGDALWHPNKTLLFGGHGFRTHPKAYDLISNAIQCEIVSIPLVDTHFYHLDTCFSILNEDVVAYVPEAFSQDTVTCIQKYFKKCIKIHRDEALSYFSGNCFCPDGKHVILQSGAKKFCDDLKLNGFSPIEVDTSEFMKAGGSVFCMKLELN